MDASLTVSVVSVVIASGSILVAWKAKQESGETQRLQTQLQEQMTAIEQARRHEEIADRRAAANAELEAKLFAWHSPIGKEVRVQNDGPSDAFDVALDVWSEGNRNLEGGNPQVRPLLRAGDVFRVPFGSMSGTSATLMYELSWRDGADQQRRGPEQLSSD